MSERTRRSLRLFLPLASDSLLQLWAHWRQQALTMIAIVWGAASVVLLLCLGTGFFEFLDLGFKKTGDRWTTVQPRYTTAESDGRRPGRLIQFDRRDLEQLRASVSAASAIAGIHDTWGWTVRTARRTRANAVTLATPEFQEIQVLQVERGRFYDQEIERLGLPVAVLGANLPEIFFGAQDPIGEMVQIRGVEFRVIGVLQRKGSQIVASDDGIHDDTIFIPLRAGQQAFGLGDWIEAFFANPRRSTDIEQMHAQIRNVLWRSHHIPDEDDGAVLLISVTEYSRPLALIALGLRLLLGIVGTVTLAMAAVGVANLMVALVNERRIELGVRRACGGRRSDLTLQLLIETLVVVVSGGLLGVLLGVSIAVAVGALPLPDMIPRPEVSPSVLATTFAVLLLTGLCAGIAPARAASRLDPAACLRVT